MNRWIVVLAVAAALPPTGVSGQDVLNVGDRVRVPDADGATVVGVVATVSPDEVLLAIDGNSTYVVAPDRIGSLERSVGQERRFARNLFVSVGITTTVGAIIGAVAWKPCTETGFLACFLHPTSRSEAASWGATAGALLGLPIGVLVGLGKKYDLWEPLSVPGVPGSALSIQPVVSPDLLGIAGSISVGGF